jgi:hypothetical protein
MSVSYQITGYDKRTEQLVRGFDVPEDRVAEVMQVARVSEAMAADFGSVPLDSSTVAQIGRHLRLNIYPEFCDWFLEPFASA